MAFCLNCSKNADRPNCGLGFNLSPSSTENVISVVIYFRAMSRKVDQALIEDYSHQLEALRFPEGTMRSSPAVGVESADVPSGIASRAHSGIKEYLMDLVMHGPPAVHINVISMTPAAEQKPSPDNFPLGGIRVCTVKKEQQPPILTLANVHPETERPSATAAGLSREFSLAAVSSNRIQTLY
jgi:hypothetical protein